MAAGEGGDRASLELTFLTPHGRQPLFVSGNEPLVLGRSLGCEVLLDDGSVSRRHAAVEPDDSIPGEPGWRIRDLGSTNGVVVDGARVQSARLAPGQRLQVGIFTLEVERPAARLPTSGIRATLVRPVREVSALWSPEALSGAVPIPIPSEEPAETPPDKRRELDRAYDNRVFVFLMRLATQLLEATDVSGVLERAVAIAFEALPARRAFALLTGEDGELTCELARYGEEVIHRPEAEPPLSKSILRAVMDERMALVTDDAQSDDRWAATGESILLHRIRSVLCAPLWSGERILGVLQLDTAFRAGAFTERDLELFTAIANYAAVAIERIRYAREVEREVARRSRLERYHSPAVVEAVLAREAYRDDGSESDGRGLESAVVTVLFLDLVGFTPFVESAGPERVVELLNATFERAVEAVFEAGGTLDKFLGDGMMAFFGAPVPQEDHAHRAVLAAVEIQRRMSALERERRAAGRPALAVRIALHSGRVMVGDVGSHSRVDYTVLGDAVNVAARLEAFVAGPGEIVLGDATAELLPEGVDLEPLGEMALKGLERKVTAYRVVWDRRTAG